VLGEPGRETVLEALVAGASISTVNLSEVVAKLVERGVDMDQAVDDVYGHEFTPVAFDMPDAHEAARLRPLTKGHGLSLGDRSCLALAQRLDLPALTADRQWDGLDVGVRIVLCR
jgi:PIN domain nuclease of toxin-antitoxin system